MMLDPKFIAAQAKQELDQEAYRAAVEARKVILRERRMRPWWKRLFPFRIRIERL